MAKVIPVYFVRFEDVLRDPREVLTRSLCFLLGEASLEGTAIEAHIEKTCSESDGGKVY